MVCKDLFGAIRAMQFFKKGMPPVHGGLLDQSADFVGFISQMDQEEMRIENDG